MDTPANDNDELSFITLSAATKNVLAYLRTEQQKRDCDEQTDRRNDQRKDNQDREQVAEGATAASEVGFKMRA